MSENKFKTMRHIETVRNIIGVVINDLMYRCTVHDQSKLQAPEVEVFEEYTPKLRDLTYGSDEYKEALVGMKPALDHHYAHNSHHPEYFDGDVSNMTLLDIIEMLCDWKAATLRHNDGDIFKSIDINKDRFGLSDQLTDILRNTAEWLEEQNYFSKADES